MGSQHLQLPTQALEEREKMYRDLMTYSQALIYTHDLEGPDDATSHIRSMLTDTSLTIPVDDGDLSLGTWQGIYIFEHRARGGAGHRRKVLVRVLSID